MTIGHVTQVQFVLKLKIRILFDILLLYDSSDQTLPDIFFSNFSDNTPLSNIIMRVVSFLAISKFI